MNSFFLGLNKMTRRNRRMPSQLRKRTTYINYVELIPHIRSLLLPVLAQHAISRPSHKKLISHFRTKFSNKQYKLLRAAYGLHDALHVAFEVHRPLIKVASSDCSELHPGVMWEQEGCKYIFPTCLSCPLVHTSTCSS